MSTDRHQGRRDWSRNFKGSSLWGKKPSVPVSARLEPIDEGSIKVAVEIPDHSVDLPTFVLVVTEDTHNKQYNKFKKWITKEHTGGDFELYTVPDTKKASFEARFPEEVFEVGKVHKLGRCSGKYIPIDRYTRTIDIERMTETLYILGDLGAKSIVLNKAAYEKASRNAEGNMNFTIPEATAVEANITNNTSHSIRATTDMVATFDEPENRPHVKEGMHWYYDNGLLPGHVMKLIPKVLDGSGYPDGDKGLEVAFSTEEEHVSLRKMQLTVSEIIGVGTKVEHTELSEFEYTFKVHFYSKKDMESLPTYFLDRESSRMLGEARRSLSALATMRAAHYLDRYIYREDILFPGDATLVPITEWMKAYDQATWAEWITAQSTSSTFRVPLVFYGPKSLDNTRAIFTLKASVAGGPGTLYSEWKSKWVEMVRDERGEHEDFMRKIRFNPGATLRGSIQKPRDQEQYEELSEKNMIRLSVFDTVDAQDFNKDVRGEEFPFGLRVLILDAKNIAKLVDSKPNKPLTAKKGADLESVEKLLGPVLTDPNVKTISRYPPIAAILTNCNDMAPHFLDLLVSFVKGQFKISHVLTMETFTTPVEYREVNAEFKAEFERIACSAITCLNSLFSCITNHEFKTHTMRTKRASFAQSVASKVKSKLF